MTVDTRERSETRRGVLHPRQQPGGSNPRGLVFDPAALRPTTGGCTAGGPVNPPTRDATNAPDQPCGLSRQTSWLILALALVIAWRSSAGGQTVLSPTLRVIPDPQQPGFHVRLFANSANQINRLHRAEAALRGELIDLDGLPLPNLANPEALGPALAPAPDLASPEHPRLFTIPTVINLNEDPATPAGEFPNDDAIPGLPALNESSDGVVGEFITYVELPAGTVSMGVHSDDGFATVAGPFYDALHRRVLGALDRGRLAATSRFTFTVIEPGVYPFRTLWFEGGDAASLEWFSYRADGSKVLLNDVARGGLKCFRALAGPPAPRPAHLHSIRPAPSLRQRSEVSASIEIVLQDGDNDPVDLASIQLRIDGEPVGTVRRSGRQTVLTHLARTLQLPSVEHTAELTFRASSTGQRTERWKFRNWKNIVLPSAGVTENFESEREGTQPAGWVASNFTARCPSTPSIRDQSSDLFRDWVLVETNNLTAIDGIRVFQIAPGQSFNGRPVDNVDLGLMNGLVLYAESDGRCTQDILGAAFIGQSQFITSKPFDLSRFRNVVLSLACIYEQNEDSYAGIEYSIDGGFTFHPIAYFLDDSDIRLHPDGTVDAVTTFLEAQPDTAQWETNGQLRGGRYLDGIAAPLHPVLGDSIVPRNDDDAADGKRYEVFFLPEASGRADVRLRFSMMGHDSWYFGIDHLAFHDVPDGLPARTLSISSVNLQGRQLTLSWSAAGGGGSYRVEESAALGAAHWTERLTTRNLQASFAVQADASPRFFRVVHWPVAASASTTTSQVAPGGNSTSTRPEPPAH